MYEDLGRVADELQQQFARLAAPDPADSLTIETRLARIEACQRAMNTLSAIQDHDLAHLAATEEVWDEDGTRSEIEHPLGSQRLDAAALASESLGVSDPVAARRVEEAIWLCTSGRLALDAKGAGRIDHFRASILAEELRDADQPTAAAVLDALNDKLGTETAGPLRRRVRRVLNRINPEVLRGKATKARGERRLERWAGDPGMDHWFATLPADHAGPAYAAIDTRAHERLTEGLNDTIDNARADALVELILGNCVGTISLQLAVPTTLLLQHAVTDAEAAALAPGEVITVEGLSTTGPVQLRRSSIQTLLNQLMTALTGNNDNDRECVSRAESPQPTTSNSNAIAASLVGCDPDTGALRTVPLDPGNRTPRANTPQLSSTAHDPPRALEALVKARDRHCRFPGCAINARFCDLDHVKAWPEGPTSIDNLICLCRRHHRIKQRDGWHPQLHPDGRVTWRDPAGRTRTTHPVDYLDNEPINQVNHVEPVDPYPRSAARKALPVNASQTGDSQHGNDQHGRPDQAPTQPCIAIPGGYHASPDYFSLIEHALEHLLAEAEALTKHGAEQPPPAPRTRTYEPPPF